MKRITLKRLAEVLDRAFLDPNNELFDTKEALKFLMDMGFLNEDRILSQGEQKESEQIARKKKTEKLPATEMAFRIQNTEASRVGFDPERDI